MPLSISREGNFSSSNDILVPSGARTATFTSDQFFTGGDIHGGVFEIRVTAATGTTPTLTVNLEDTLDRTNWNLVQAVNASPITATGTTVLRINLRTVPTADWLRLNCVIGGTTPSFTFSVRAFLVRN